jgi:hypothetical protein
MFHDFSTSPLINIRRLASPNGKLKHKSSHRGLKYNHTRRARSAVTTTPIIGVYTCERTPALGGALPVGDGADDGAGAVAELCGATDNPDCDEDT